MKKEQTASLIPDELVLNNIYLIREQKVILDSDLAELYGVETKVGAAEEKCPELSPNMVS